MRGIVAHLWNPDPLIPELLSTPLLRTQVIRRYESPITKSPELIFSALVGDDGAHNVRFERALGT
jgi:hypothetical protein